MLHLHSASSCAFPPARLPAHRGAPSRRRYVNPVFYSELWTLLGRPKDKQAPSTGLLAITLALGVCGTR